MRIFALRVAALVVVQRHGGHGVGGQAASVQAGGSKWGIQTRVSSEGGGGGGDVKSQVARGVGGVVCYVSRRFLPPSAGKGKGSDEASRALLGRGPACWCGVWASARDTRRRLRAVSRRLLPRRRARGKSGIAAARRSRGRMGGAISKEWYSQAVRRGRGRTKVRCERSGVSVGAARSEQWQGTSRRLLSKQASKQAWRCGGGLVGRRGRARNHRRPPARFCPSSLRVGSAAPAELRLLCHALSRYRRAHAVCPWRARRPWRHTNPSAGHRRNTQIMCSS